MLAQVPRPVKLPDVRPTALVIGSSAGYGLAATIAGPELPWPASATAKSRVGGRQRAQCAGRGGLISGHQVVLEGAEQPRLHFGDLGRAVLADRA